MANQELESAADQDAKPRSPQIYINGTLFDKENAKVSVFDHGLLYGDGVFEGNAQLRGAHLSFGAAFAAVVGICKGDLA